MPSILLVDMDGVLADFVGGVVARMPLYGLDHDTADPDTYGYLRRDFSAATINAIIRRPGFFRELKSLPGGVETVKQIEQQTLYDVFFVSTPLPNSPHNWGEKRDWIATHFGREWVGRLILAEDKTLVRGDILIDDRPDVNRGKYTPEWTHWLYDQPYNQHAENAFRVDWRSIRYKLGLEPLLCLS